VTSGDRKKVTKEAVAGIAMAGVLAVGASVASAASVAADPTLPWVPAVPSDPAPPNVPPPSHMFNPLAQNGTDPGIAGLPAMGGLPGGWPDTSGNTPNEYVLSQNPVPEAPGGAPATPVHMNPFNNQYLLPQNLEPAAPGQGELFEIPQGQENADIAPIDYLRRLWHQYQEGYLEGGMLGQMPHEQLGEPLPGTAPPPGTTVPVGLGQNLPEPPPPPEPVPPTPASAPPA
jgi:hypothetical protein